MADLEKKQQLAMEVVEIQLAASQERQVKMQEALLLLFMRRATTFGCISQHCRQDCPQSWVALGGDPSENSSFRTKPVQGRRAQLVH